MTWYAKKSDWAEAKAEEWRQRLYTYRREWKRQNSFTKGVEDSYRREMNKWLERAERYRAEEAMAA